jgi:hypothetical protein
MRGRSGLVPIALLVLLAMSTISKPAASCGPPDLGKMPPLSFAQLRSVAKQAGFTGAALDIAVAVAMAESGGYPEASGDPLCGVSLGLWQINVASHPEFKGNPDVLFDPLTNAKAAYKISNGGTSWGPWSTYTTKVASQSFRRYMPGGPLYPKEGAA